jgi:hypothetical protein
LHPTPHNQLFESVFSDPAQATAYLKDVLPVPLVDGVNWSTLRKAPGSFVDESLRSRHSDLLFDVQLTDGRPLRVFVLFEHQSSSDRWMAWRLLRYMVKIWDQWLAEHPEARRLPLIYPLVLFHGPDAWEGPKDFKELLDWNHSLMDARLEPHLPRFRFQLEELSFIPDHDLRGLPLGRMVLLLFKYYATDNLWRLLPQWVDTLRDVRDAPNGLRALEKLLRYILSVSDPDDDFPEEAIHSFLSSDLGDQALETYMTGAQFYINKGIKQGIEKGREEGIEKGREEGQLMERRALLKRLLEQRFGSLSAEHAERIDGADYETLDAWLNRFFQVESPEALLRG